MNLTRRSALVTIAAIAAPILWSASPAHAAVQTITPDSSTPTIVETATNVETLLRFNVGSATLANIVSTMPGDDSAQGQAAVQFVKLDASGGLSAERFPLAGPTVSMETASLTPGKWVLRVVAPASGTPVSAAIRLYFYNNINLSTTIGATKNMTMENGQYAQFQFRVGSPRWVEFRLDSSSQQSNAFVNFNMAKIGNPTVNVAEQVNAYAPFSADSPSLIVFLQPGNYVGVMRYFGLPSKVSAGVYPFQI